MENQPQPGTEHPLTAETYVHMAPSSLFAAIMLHVDTLHEHATMATPYTTLLSQLANPAWEVRTGALYNLVKQHAHLPLEMLAGTLHDEHPSVREAAVCLLGQQGEDVPLDYVVLALQDRDSEVRAMAMQVLEEQRAQCMAPQLTNVLASSDKQAGQQDGLIEADQPYRAAFLAREVDTGLPQVRQHTQRLQQAWLVFTSQFRLLRLNLIAGAACLIACYGFVFVALRAHFSTMLLLLTWISLFFTGIGTIMTNNKEQDRVLELALATPTSPRFMLFCRWLFTIGPQLVLALIMTCSMALFYHQSLASMAQLWLTPMLAPLMFVSALALLSSFLLKSWLVYILISFVPSVQLPDGHWLLLNVPPQILVVLAILCLILLFFDHPRHLQRMLRHK